MDGAGQMKSSVKRLFGVLEVGQETSAHEGLPELEPLYALMYMHTHRHSHAHSRILTHCQMQKLLDQSHCSSWCQVAVTMEGESTETTAPESQFP